MYLDGFGKVLVIVVQKVLFTRVKKKQTYKQNKTKQNKTKQNKTKQTKQNKTKQNKAKKQNNKQTKKHTFGNFSKIQILAIHLTILIPCEIPFLKIYTFIIYLISCQVMLKRFSQIVTIFRGWHLP